MGKTDKKKPRYLSNDDVEKEKDSPTQTLIVVEGATEIAYFKGLLYNTWLKNRLGSYRIYEEEKTDKDGKKDISSAGNLVTAIDIANKNSSAYAKIWIVSDNDKRNAFVLQGDKSPCILDSLAIDEKDRDILNASYNDKCHRYFLSVYDYIKWVSSSIGAEKTVEYWDTIQSHTPKNRDFEKHFSTNRETIHPNIHLAYSCIAFEFWMLLHFEYNTTPFLWVEKFDDDAIDVYAYFKKISGKDYKKGINSNGGFKIDAYKILYDNPSIPAPTLEEEWSVIYRVIKAYKNAIRLRDEMAENLKKHCNEWWKLNPYINEGMNHLIAELLNIKQSNELIISEDWEIKISPSRDNNNLSLNLKITPTSGESFELSHSEHHSNFQIKTISETYLPKKFDSFDVLETNEINLLYEDIPQEETDLVLVFKNPSSKHTTEILIIISNL